MVIFPKVPTMNYIMPMETMHICAVAAITNACEHPPYLSIDQFIRVIATQQGF